MDNRENRWVAGILLLAMFGVIAYAGGRGAPRAQGTQSVLVTNTSSQPVPIAARPGTGAYIVAVSNAPTVKVASSATAPVVTKDANNPDANAGFVLGSFTLNSLVSGNGTASFTLSSQPCVIDEISIDAASAVAGETIDTGSIIVTDSLLQGPGTFIFAAPTLQNNSAHAVAMQAVRIPVAANGSVQVWGNRSGGTTNTCSVSYTIAYHTVPNP